MILTGSKIREEVKRGAITITSFTEDQLNPNSYDLRLGEELKIYAGLYDARGGVRAALDPAHPSTFDPCIPLEVYGSYSPLMWPQGGIHSKVTDIKYKDKSRLFLLPGQLYLAHTEEIVGSTEYVPMLADRSSIARMGVATCKNAGFGDLGFCAQWTLEITVDVPVILYAGMKICQVYFMSTLGDKDIKYTGKYVNQQGATPSQIFKDKS